MSTTRSVSRLEALPSEIFNSILSYVLDPTQSLVPESSTAFRSYRFDTTLLRVSKGIHDVAKSYLHHSLSWIRFDINWRTLLIDPHWLGIPYITIDCADEPKARPLKYSNEPMRRSPKQQAPPGRIAVRIKFPTPSSPGQKKIRAQCFNSPFDSCISALVLEQDVSRFMTILRMNDLAYCGRLLPDEKTSIKALTTRSDEGMSFDIQIQPNQELKRYKHLVDFFKVFCGPFHQVNITGHKDAAHAGQVAEHMELRWPNQDRRKAILAFKCQTHWEGIKYMMVLKYCGDEALREGQHAKACMHYDYATTFEKYWILHDPQPATRQFWTQASPIYKAFGISLACNMAIAYATGGLDAPSRNVRNETMIDYVVAVTRMSAGGALLGKDRYLEILFATTLCHIRHRNAVRPFHTVVALQGLRSCLMIMTSTWEDRHTIDCVHESSSAIGMVYRAAKALVAVLPEEMDENKDDIPAVDKEKRAATVKESLDLMSTLMHEAKIKPMTWAIREERFPEQLLRLLCFLPVVQIKRKEIVTSQDVDITLPEFDLVDLAELGEEAVDRRRCI